MSTTSAFVLGVLGEPATLLVSHPARSSLRRQLFPAFDKEVGTWGM